MRPGVIPGPPLFMITYFEDVKGNIIRQGDKVQWDGEPDRVWIVSSDPLGHFNDDWAPDSPYMRVWVRPQSDVGGVWNSSWVCRGTRGFVKID